MCVYIYVLLMRVGECFILEGSEYFGWAALDEHLGVELKGALEKELRMSKGAGS